ncbi:H/ACA ribonucleoprotein complex subunit 2 isoform c [Homo sapiens]|nr:H/ACA ribonucleoprotein complex subunit 2 isoform c [Homo sapiens]
MTKIKADPDGPEAQAEACSGERTYQELLVNQNPIAQPLASRRLTRKLYKCIKKAVKQKQIRRGVKEVQKFVNKGEKGIMVLAGDTLPIEVYCHLPVMCEDRNLPYVYIPSKTFPSCKVGIPAQALWLTPVILVLWEAKTGGSVEDRSSGITCATKTWVQPQAPSAPPV